MPRHDRCSCHIVPQHRHCCHWEGPCCYLALTAAQTARATASTALPHFGPFLPIPNPLGRACIAPGKKKKLRAVIFLKMWQVTPCAHSPERGRSAKSDDTDCTSDMQLGDWGSQGPSKTIPTTRLPPSISFRVFSIRSHPWKKIFSIWNHIKYQQSHFPLNKLFLDVWWSSGWKGNNIPLSEALEETKVIVFILCCFENKCGKDRRTFFKETFDIKCHTRDYSHN